MLIRRDLNRFGASSLVSGVYKGDLEEGRRGNYKLWKYRRARIAPNLPVRIYLESINV